MNVLIIVLLMCTAGYAVDTKQVSKPAPQKKSKRVFVDGIQAVFRGSEGVDLVLASEVNRPRLDGSIATLQDSLTNLAFAQEARRYKIFPTPEEIEKQYEMIANSNKKTVKELDAMVMQAGFTPAEARKEFAQINAVNSLINYKVTGNMVVPESEVVAYYEENPEYEPASYLIETTLVPFSSVQSRSEQLAQLQALANAGDPNNILNWADQLWINEEDIAADKKFLTELSSGQISLPREAFNGFQLFRLAKKKAARLKSLDERYGQIVTILRRPKYTELMNTFQKELMDNASVIIFNVPG